MSDRTELYERVRAASCKLLGYDPAALTDAQALQVDLATILRLTIDDMTAATIAGKQVDVTKLTAASEALAKLAPATVQPPARFTGDPRKRLVEIVSAAIRRAPADVQWRFANPPNPPVSELDHLRAELAAARAELAALRGTPPAPAENNPPPDAPAEEPAEPSNVTPLPLKSARKVHHGPNGETWTEPGPNEPPQAKPGWLTKMQAAAVNGNYRLDDAPTRRPDLRAKSQPWTQAGGGAGFEIRSSPGGGSEPWREHVSGNEGFFWGGPSGRRSR